MSLQKLNTTKTVPTSNASHDKTECKFNQGGCKLPVLKEFLCESHYLQKVRIVLRRTIKNMYRGPVQAFAWLNQSRVRPYITLEDILSHFVVERAGLVREDVKKYLLNDIFKTEDTHLNY